MIAPRFGLVAVAVLAALLARKRPGARPVSVTLGALAAIDIARGTGLPPRPSAALWIAWACVQGAYTWRAWKRNGPGTEAPSPMAARTWAAARPVNSSAWERVHPITLALACLALPALPFLPIRWTPLTWHVLLVAPHVAAVAIGLVAWAGARPRTVAQAVALVLTWSAALDVAIGALAPGAGWVRAAPLAWAAWGAVGVVLLAASAKRA